jgi:hypothetical protein
MNLVEELTRRCSYLDLKNRFNEEIEKVYENMENVVGDEGNESYHDLAKKIIDQNFNSFKDDSPMTDYYNSNKRNRIVYKNSTLVINNIEI